MMILLYTIDSYSYRRIMIHKRMYTTKLPDINNVEGNHTTAIPTRITYTTTST